uniref:NADH:ubiquinone reductase (H(+)-translocating) n=1 Tax=Arrenurus rostratus TaxID=3136836 RepID=A0AAU6QDQ0_9ACAR
MMYYISFFFFVFHLVSLLLLFMFFDSGVFFTFCFSLGGSFSMDYTFVFDKYSLGFSSFVLLISSVVFLYSGFYLSGDKTFYRYLYILFFFVLSMLMLIFSMNFFGIMLGWDGLGLVSFLLVIYYGNFSSLRSGILTVLTNRFGDMMMILSFFYFFSLGYFGESVFYLGDFSILMFLLFFSAMTKSAQLPFSAWLPAAMAAPTPVSSLVHSSTLVTAGVYLMIRFYEVFSFLLNSFAFSVFSLMTMFFSGLLAFFEMDMKKVVAMSTLSQLGVMMFSISLGEWVFCYFHMVCHALFKSLLFLSCGGFISFSLGGQDLRSKGGYIFSSPFFLSVFSFSSLSLCGFPFLSGFFSKDHILEGIMSGGLMVVFYLFFYASCMFTVIYSFRLFFWGLFFFCNSSVYVSFSSFKEVYLSMLVLSFWSVVSGGFFGFMMMFDNYMYMFSMLKVLTIMLMFFSIVVYFVMNKIKYSLGMKMFFSDLFYMFWFSGSGFSWISSIFGVFSTWELLWVEMMGPKGISSSIEGSSSYLVSVDSFFYKMIYVFVGIFLMYLMYKYCF